MIWQSQNLIIQNDRLYVYFGGCEGPHRQLIDTRAPSIDVNHQERIIKGGAHFITFNAALCRASWRFDRMYALVCSAGGRTVGTATTKSKLLVGGKLWVNVRTRGEKRPTPHGYNDGKLQVELLDSAGNPIDGFAREHCTPDKRSLDGTLNRSPSRPLSATAYHTSGMKVCSVIGVRL